MAASIGPPHCSHFCNTDLLNSATYQLTPKMNSEVHKVHFARKGEPEMGLTFIVSCTKHVLAELYRLPPPSPSVSLPRSSSLNDSANVAVHSNPSVASHNGSIREAPPFPPLASIQFPTSPDEDRRAHV